jgi:hypothetical protein
MTASNSAAPGSGSVTKIRSIQPKATHWIRYLAETPSRVAKSFLTQLHHCADVGEPYLRFFSFTLALDRLALPEGRTNQLRDQRP